MCGAESLNARMGVQPREAELGGVREARESLRMLFSVGASALNKWFQTSGVGPSLAPKGPLGLEIEGAQTLR